MADVKNWVFLRYKGIISGCGFFSRPDCRCSNTNSFMCWYKEFHILVQRVSCVGTKSFMCWYKEFSHVLIQRVSSCVDTFKKFMCWYKDFHLLIQKIVCWYKARYYEGMLKLLINQIVKPNWVASPHVTQSKGNNVNFYNSALGQPKALQTYKSSGINMINFTKQNMSFPKSAYIVVRKHNNL